MSEPEASDQGTIRETIAELVDRIRATTQDGAVVRRVQMLTPTGERTEPFRLSNGVALVADGEGLRTLAENTATGRRLLGEELVANFEKLVTVVGDAAERAGTPRDSAERDVRLQATQTRIGLGEHAVDTLGSLMDDANRNYGTLHRRTGCPS